MGNNTVFKSLETISIGNLHTDKDKNGKEYCEFDKKLKNRYDN